MSGYNLPDGCSVGDIPGFRPIDAKYDDAESRLDKMSTDEVVDLLEDLFPKSWLVECFNEADFDVVNESELEWRDDYDGATEDELKKFVEYILSFKRDDVLTHIVEGG